MQEYQIQIFLLRTFHNTAIRYRSVAVFDSLHRNYIGQCLASSVWGIFNTYIISEVIFAPLFRCLVSVIFRYIYFLYKLQRSKLSQSYGYG